MWLREHSSGWAVSCAGILLAALTICSSLAAAPKRVLIIESFGRDVPPSTIQFQEPTIWEKYRWHVVGVVGFCGLEAALIAGLFVNLFKRRQAEAMAGLAADISSRFINLAAEKLDPEIEQAQRRICECLGLELSSLWQWIGEPPRYFTITHLYRPLGGPPLPERVDAREMFPGCLQQVLQ